MKTDLYGECNLDSIPVDVFTAECCMRCANPDCTRSTAGQSKFDLRVNTWYERLFSNVPKMSPDNPKFESFSSQKFFPINPSLSINSKWIDPNVLEKEILANKNSIELESKTLQSDLPIGPEQNTLTVAPMVDTKIQKDSSQEEISNIPSRPHLTKDLVGANTPVQQGQMIGLEQATPVNKTSWEVNPPTEDTKNIRVIKPGEKVRLGS
jgi:hypothetical protein